MTDYEELCNAINTNQDFSIIVELVKKVKLTNDDELNSLEQDGKSPLYLAVERKDPMVIKLLLDNGAEINLKDYG